MNPPSPRVNGSCVWGLICGFVWLLAIITALLWLAYCHRP